jgi:glucose-6-phosphate isomerase
LIAIGIGGSYLGPEFVFEALRTDPQGLVAAEGRALRFLANVDPVDIARALSGLDAESTLVVIVSKTFTTAETMLNARTLRRWLLESLPGFDEKEVLAKHLAAVSSAVPKAQAFGVDPSNVFGFWDWVGGRYSVCSAVGCLPLALHYGPEIVRQFLAGAADMDKHFFEAPLRTNLPVLLGLLGLWNSSFLGHPARALLPYAQALLRFPAHIQQVDMESNGKRVALNGSVLPFAAGEIVLGEPGTNGQHSFYQLLHQGRVVPAEFVGFAKSPQPVHLPGEAVSNHDELMSNFFAQPDALAVGKTIAELEKEGVPQALWPHKEFPGNRPSLSLLFSELSPFSLGQLLALYEHRVAVQGFVWGINSFDQWGVELGKVLAGRVRNQLAACRAAGTASKEAMGADFNPSTAYLLARYLAAGNNSSNTAAAEGAEKSGNNA